jgi:hypothetical protein
VINTLEEHNASIFRSALKIEAEGSSEALITIHKNKKCQNTEDYYLKNGVYYCISCQSSLTFQDFLMDNNKQHTGERQIQTFKTQRIPV